jgi:hypothetical protein
LGYGYFCKKHQTDDAACAVTITSGFAASSTGTKARSTVVRARGVSAKQRSKKYKILGDDDG